MSLKWEKRFALMRLLGKVALAGLVLAIVAIFTSDVVQILAIVSASILVLPAFVYLYLLVIWHWKDRYRGQHSDLWGAVILIETSGWMKLVYLFRYLIPDRTVST